MHCLLNFTNFVIEYEKTGIIFNIIRYPADSM